MRYVDGRDLQCLYGYLLGGLLGGWVTFPIYEPLVTARSWVGEV
jgi:hypothetical protein